MTVPGMDISSYQDDNHTPQQIDFSKAYAQGARFCFIRASFGSMVDEDLKYNSVESQRARLLRSAYQFIDYRKAAKPQAQLLYSLSQDYGYELPHVLDLEPFWLPLPPAPNMLAWVREWFDVADALFNRPGIFYSNPSSIQYWLTTIPDWLKAHPLWIAHYGPKVPDFRPWKAWKFWQYSSTGPGLAWGMESKGLDMDVWNGTYDELLAFAGLGSQPQPEITDKEKLDRLWAAHPELH